MYQSQPSSAGNGWRNWYLVFSHGCDTTDCKTSPQPKHLSCGDIWKFVMSQQWPKMRYQFLYYHGTTKLTLNKRCFRIWSWPPMPCEKHGLRDSVDIKRGWRPRCLSLLRPEGHVFHTARETMIKSYYTMLTDWFFFCFIHINMKFIVLKGAIFGSLHGC